MRGVGVGLVGSCAMASEVENLSQLEEEAASGGEPARVSGRQEALENLLNDYLYGNRVE